MTPQEGVLELWEPGPGKFDADFIAQAFRGLEMLVMPIKARAARAPRLLQCAGTGYAHGGGRG